jgi:hypothetical protein
VSIFLKDKVQNSNGRFASSCVTYVASILLRLLKVANEIQNNKKKYFYNVPSAG